MTIDQAIETLMAEFERRYPGYHEARARYERAVEGSRLASVEFNAAKEALTAFNQDDEYLIQSIRGVKEALGIKP